MDETASNSAEPLTPEQRQSLMLEYKAAQDMLKHYDSLNWQIGSILIAGVTVLTGLVINKDTIMLMRANKPLGFSIAAGVVFFSGVILYTWLQWFTRHRDLYNFRNEVLHRVEQRLHMYHFLKVAHINLPQNDEFKTLCLEEQEEIIQTLEKAKGNAGYGLRGKGKFAPFYKQEKLNRPSGHALARRLVWMIIIMQVALFTAILFVPEAKPPITNTAPDSSQPTTTPSPASAHSTPIEDMR
ncbi:MAG: hypothetical protein WCD76_17390 [Pyrinomonadaceae bacterium]